MGCGKSSVGKKLSSLLSCSWADTDQEIERKTGKSIQEIFDGQGEAAFRQLELETLRELIARKVHIISLGGGTPALEASRDLLRENTVCIWLKARPETLLEHMKLSYQRRPLLQDIPADDPDQWQEAMLERIATLLKKRESDYAAIAGFTIEVDGKSRTQVMTELIDLLNSSL